MTSNMTIGKKLMLACGAMLALTLGLAYSSLSSVGSLGKALDVEINKTGKKIELVGADPEKRVGNAGGRSAGEVLYSVSQGAHQSVESEKELLRTGGDNIQKSIAEIRLLLVTPVGKQALERYGLGSRRLATGFGRNWRSCSNQRFDAELQQTITKSAELLGQIDAAGSAACASSEGINCAGRQGR